MATSATVPAKPDYDCDIRTSNGTPDQNACTAQTEAKKVCEWKTSTAKWSTGQCVSIVAFSSGNFGQGLAAACGQIMKPTIQCTIVMPGDTPLAKQTRARSYGAKVVLSNLIPGINREVTAAELAQSLATKHGYTLLHPFEDYDVIAGQGSCAVEICQQCDAIQVTPDIILRSGTRMEHCS